VSVIFYHTVCPAKYRRVVFTDEVDEVLKGICLEISKRYEIRFIEIGVDDDVHFLIQSVSMYSTTRIIRIVKSITAREIFCRVPSVKEVLWGGEFWTGGHFTNTVSQFGNEKTIVEYVKKQGREREYKKLHQQQLTMFGFDTP